MLSFPDRLIASVFLWKWPCDGSVSENSLYIYIYIYTLKCEEDTFVCSDILEKKNTQQQHCYLNAFTLIRPFSGHDVKGLLMTSVHDVDPISFLCFEVTALWRTWTIVAGVLCRENALTSWQRKKCRSLHILIGSPSTGGVHQKWFDFFVLRKTPSIARRWWQKKPGSVNTIPKRS